MARRLAALWFNAYDLPLRVFGREHLTGLTGPVILLCRNLGRLTFPALLQAFPGPISFVLDRAWDRPALLAALSRRSGNLHGNLLEEGEIRRGIGDALRGGRSVGLFLPLPSAVPPGLEPASNVQGPPSEVVTRLWSLAVEWATQYQLPILPVVADGIDLALPAGHRLPRVHPIRVLFGEALRPPPVADPSGPIVSGLALTEWIRQEEELARRLESTPLGSDPGEIAPSPINPPVDAVR